MQEDFQIMTITCSIFGFSYHRNNIFINIIVKLLSNIGGDSNKRERDRKLINVKAGANSKPINVERGKPSKTIILDSTFIIETKVN